MDGNTEKVKEEVKRKRYRPKRKSSEKVKIESSQFAKPDDLSTSHRSLLFPRRR